MHVTLIDFPSLRAMKRAAGICRNSPDEEAALWNALKAGHDGLLEHALFSFEVIGVSKALTHQLVRHRIGCSYAQQSQRHVQIQIESVEWYITPKTAVPLFHKTMQIIGASYLECIKQGMPLEDARYLLPNGCMSNLVMSMNARALEHFFNLRKCTRAQWEIRNLAERVFAICSSHHPEIFNSKGYPNCIHCPEPCGNPIN